jgi:tripartite-type tricarboxylate transporter receptor subunit TctC
MKNGKFTALLTAVLLSTVLAVQPFMASYAQAAKFPKKGKRLKWIITHSPGGGYDTTSRMAIRAMQKVLGITIIARNVPGAGGRLGVNEIYRAKPDGYTIGMIAIPGMMVTQMVAKTKFDVTKFKYLGRLAVQSYCLSVNPKSSLYTFQDLLNAKKPLRSSVTGGGTGMIVNILTPETLKIPYTLVSGFGGSTECIVALMAGNVDYTMTGSIVTHARYVKSGDLRTIFTLTRKRSKALPDVPSVTELGIKVPEYLLNMQLMRVMVAPPETPDEIVAILRKALMKVTEDKDFLSWGNKVNAGIEPASGEEMQKIIYSINADIPKFEHMVKPYFDQ